MTWANCEKENYVVVFCVILLLLLGVLVCSITFTPNFLEGSSSLTNAPNMIVLCGQVTGLIVKESRG